MKKLVELLQVKQSILAAKKHYVDLFLSAADAIQELNTVKAEKTSAVSIVIPTSEWNHDSTVAKYPFYYDILADSVTEKDRAVVTIAPESMDAAVSCKLCPTNETLAGKIRIRSVSVPAVGIAAEYWIEQGKE